MDHGEPRGDASTEENGGVAEDYRDEGEGGVHRLHPLKQPARSASFPSFVGKHRLQAAISHLNNEINVIEKELEQLETMGESSSVCKEVISSVETIPDPLLPVTKGSVESSWDRWFGGAHNSRSHKRWI